MHGFSKLHASLTTAALVVSLLLGAPSLASAQSTGVVPGNLRAYSTIHSIGLEWHVTGDGNHNASATVEYRAQGSEAWRDALPLVRVDNNGANMLAGSVLFLEPGTLYDVRVSLSDPDGGADSRMVAVATRALPTLPLGGRTFHVVPGTGGGQGSSSDPFKGIAAAQAVAQPGDVFLLHTGAYGGRIRFAKSGTAQKHVVWKAAGDGEVRMDGVDIAASHVWVEGVTVRNQSFAMLSSGAPENVVVIRCAFYNNHYGLHLSGGGKDWYIADNTIVGDTPYTTGSFSGEGIDLAKTGGHTVAHNSITNVADGISYPSTNVDIFGNDIFDTSDDGIEADNGLANVRIWGNRIHNAAHNGITFQPQSGAPWYIIRNQIIGNMEGAFKFRTTDRFVLMHNTIVSGGRTSDDAMICCNEHHLLNAIARNNLWISARGGQIWGFGTFSKDWRTDLDFDGFDWGASTRPFAYQGLTYRDLPSFAAASGLERHGVHVSRDTCFETFDVPGPAPTPIPPQVLSLQPGCAAMDAGVALPNINDGFAGAAPDMGAYEYGLPAPVFGPRAAVVDVPPPPAPAPTPAPTSDTTPPTARITSPSGNVWTGSSILIAASATDNAALKHIELWGAGKVFATLPCSGTSCSGSSRWSTSALTTGAYQVHAVAVDAAGNRTLSTPILVYKNGTSPQVASGATGATAPTPAPPPTSTTGDATAPTAGITSPTGSVWTGNSIGVSASASDDVGLATITLWGNGVRFGTITCSGGSCSGTIRWTTGALPPVAPEATSGEVPFL